jgi:hypothetical protein
MWKRNPFALPNLKCSRSLTMKYNIFLLFFSIRTKFFIIFNKGNEHFKFFLIKDVFPPEETAETQGILTILHKNSVWCKNITLIMR